MKKLKKIDIHLKKDLEVYKKHFAEKYFDLEDWAYKNYYLEFARMAYLNLRIAVINKAVSKEDFDDNVEELIYFISSLKFEDKENVREGYSTLKRVLKENIKNKDLSFDYYEYKERLALLDLLKALYLGNKFEFNFEDAKDDIVGFLKNFKYEKGSYIKKQYCELYLTLKDKLKHEKRRAFIIHSNCINSLYEANNKKDFIKYSKEKYVSERKRVLSKFVN